MMQGRAVSRAREGERALSDSHVYVGIDVAEATLEVACRPSAEGWQATNDGVGITGLVERLLALKPELVVLEATGGVEVQLVAELAAAGVPAAVLNPRQVRDFTESDRPVGED